MSRFDNIVEVRKYNHNHGADGRFTSGKGGGGASALSEKRKIYDKESDELERMEDEYTKYSNKYDALDREARACRVKDDREGEANAKRKMKELNDEIYEFEQKLHDKRKRVGDLGREAYELEQESYGK